MNWRSRAYRELKKEFIIFPRISLKHNLEYLQTADSTTQSQSQSVQPLQTPSSGSTSSASTTVIRPHFFPQTSRIQDDDIQQPGTSSRKSCLIVLFQTSREVSSELMRLPPLEFIFAWRKFSQNLFASEHCTFRKPTMTQPLLRHMLILLSFFHELAWSQTSIFKVKSLWTKMMRKSSWIYVSTIYPLSEVTTPAGPIGAFRFPSSLLLSESLRSSSFSSLPTESPIGKGELLVSLVLFPLQDDCMSTFNISFNLSILSEHLNMLQRAQPIIWLHLSFNVLLSCFDEESISSEL